MAEHASLDAEDAGHLPAQIGEPFGDFPRVRRREYVCSQRVKRLGGRYELVGQEASIRERRASLHERTGTDIQRQRRLGPVLFHKLDGIGEVALRAKWPCERTMASISPHRIPLRDPSRKIAYPSDRRQRGWAANTAGLHLTTEDSA
jgi:hypothetical protein